MENNENIEERVLGLCKDFKDGVTYKMIENTLQNVQLKDIVPIINNLLAKNKVDLLQKSDGTILIKTKDFESKSRYQGGTKEEQMIVKVITESQNDGIEPREIRFKTNIPAPTITKILKTLISKNFVKTFHAISAPKRNRYILFKLDPNPAFLGGFLFQGDDLDVKLIEVLNEQCYKYMERKAQESKTKSSDPYFNMMASWCSVQEVRDYIERLQIINVKIEAKDIESILEGMSYDDKVQKSNSTSSGENIYRVTNSFSSTSTLMSFPCGVCPYIFKCDKVGTVNARNCEYMKKFEF